MKKKILLAMFLFLFLFQISKSQNNNNFSTPIYNENSLIINNSSDSLDTTKEEGENFSVLINSNFSSKKNYSIFTKIYGKSETNTALFSIVSGGRLRNVGAFFNVEGENATNIGVVNNLKNGTYNIGVLNGIMENYNNKSSANIGVFNKILNNGDGKNTTYNYGVHSGVSGTNNTNIAFLGSIVPIANDEGITVFPDNSKNYLQKGDIKANDSENYGLYYTVTGQGSKNTGLHVEVGPGVSNRAAYLKGDVMFESIEGAPYFMWNQRTGFMISGHGAYPNIDKMGVNSFSMGMNSFAYDNSSAAIGEGVITSQPGQLAVGTYNYIKNDTSMIMVGPLLQVGNGRVGKRGNAFEVSKEGRTFQDWIGINQPDNSDRYEKIDSALSMISKIKGMSYHWEDTYDHPSSKVYGYELSSFIKAFPDLAYRNSEAENTLNHVGLIPIITESIIELDAKSILQEKLLNSALEKIEILSKELETLKAKITIQEGVKKEDIDMGE